MDFQKLFMYFQPTHTLFISWFEKLYNHSKLHTKQNTDLTSESDAILLHGKGKDTK